MPDPTPIPSASALARAVEASRENYDAAYRDGWNAAASAAFSGLCGKAHVARANGRYEKAAIIEECLDAMPPIRALRRDTPDVG